MLAQYDDDQVAAQAAHMGVPPEQIARQRSRIVAALLEQDRAGKSPAPEPAPAPPQHLTVTVEVAWGGQVLGVTATKVPLPSTTPTTPAQKDTRT